MITIEQARDMFERIVEEHPGHYKVEQVQLINLEQPLYVMIAIDENGNQIFPGEVFPSVRKEDGMFVDYEFPCPA